MLQELLITARRATALLAILAFAVGAAAVTGLALLASGAPPKLAAAGALVTPVACGAALAAAVRGAHPGPATLASTLVVANGVLPATVDG